MPKPIKFKAVKSRIKIVNRCIVCNQIVKGSCLKHLEKKHKITVNDTKGEQMKRQPTKQQIKLWNRLVKEVFNHPKSQYSLFVYELIKRRVLGTSREEYRGTITEHKKLDIDCVLFNKPTKKDRKENK